MTQMFPKPRGAGSDKPEVFLGAFGKHPGWNDHIDDQGMETQQLIDFKRLLYINGVSAAIDSGAWDRLDESQRVDGFGHVVVLSRRGEIIACRLWSSSDGKGRTKYPMAVCVHARNVPLGWVLSQVLPKLERLQARCIESPSAAAVTAILDNARVELRAVLPAVGSSMDPVVPRVLAQLAQRPELGGGDGPGGAGTGHEGLYRLLYQVQRDCKDFMPRVEGNSKSTRNISQRPQHIRVPACADSTADAAQIWIQFLHHTVERSVTVTVVVPTSAPPGWTDLLVGEPEGAQFFCLRAAPRALPPVTQVPYSIDQAFVDACEARIKLSQEGREETSLAQAAAAARSPGLLGRLFGQRKSMFFISVAVVLVLAGATILFLLTRGSGEGQTPKPDPKLTRSDPPRQSTPSTGPSAPTTTPDTGNAQATSAADEPWQQLCDHFNNWGLLLIQKLDERPRGGAASYASRRELYLSDPYLTRVFSPLFKALQEGVAIDPRSIAGISRDERLASIRKSPPAGAMTPAAQDRIKQSLTLMGGIARELSAEAWPALRQTVAVEKRLRELGRAADADFLRTVADGASVTDSRDLAPGIDRLLTVAPTVQSLTAKLATIDAASAAAAASGDAELTRLPGWLASQLAPGSADQPELAGLQALDTAAGKLAEPLAPLVEFLTQNAPNLDRGVLGAKRSAQAGSPLSREGLISWLDDAKNSLKLPVELDPRRAWTMEKLLADAAGLKARLQGELKKDPDAALVAREKKLADEIAALKALAWNSDSRAQLTRVMPRLETDLRLLVQDYDNLYSTEKVRVQGSAQEVRQQLKSQETIVVRSEAINAAWRAERDRLLAAFTDSQYAQMGDKVARVRARFIALDEALPAGIKVEAGGRRWAAALITEVQSERERRLQAAIQAWSAAGADESGDRFKAMQETLVADFSKWADGIDRLATDLAGVETLLNQGYGYDEKPAGGVAIRTTLAPWSESPIVKSPTISSAIAGLMDRARALEALEKVQDRFGLLAAFSSSTASNPEQAVAAWRQLGKLASPAWPADIKQLDEELKLQERLSTVAAEIRPVQRKEALEQEFASQRAARWERAFATFKDPGQIEAAADRLGAFGVKPESLAPRLRYNLALVQLKQRVVAGSLPDDQVVTASSGFAKAAASFGTPVQDAPVVKPLLTELSSIASQTPVAEPKVDVTKLGPGSLPGWTGQSRGSVAEFTRDSGVSRLSLRFIRIDPPEGSAFYIGQNEVSLGTVLGLLNASGDADGWTEFRNFWTDDATEGDPRFGPRVWQWTASDRSVAKLRLSDRWQKEVIRVMRGGKETTPPDSPPSLTIRPPSLAHPMNYLSPAAAVYLSSLAGSRLPTSQEWQFAAKAFPPDLSAANLRDSSWKAQQDYIKSLLAKRPNAFVSWPDAGIFRPASPGDIPREDGATSRSSNDGHVWFAPAIAEEAPSGDAPTHLVGNIAEYVIDASPPGSGSTASGAMAYANAHRGETRIIGGSALSPPECAVDKPLAFTDPEESVPGFSDIGFRLVFSATGTAPAPEPLFGRFARAVASAGYIEP